MGTILLLALLGAVEPEPATTHATIAGSATVGYSSFDPAHAVDGTGNVAGIIYLRPLVDDDAPRSLQPFLQRASTVSLGFSLGGFTTSQGAATLKQERLFGQSAALDAYLGRTFALTGAIGVTQYRDQRLGTVPQPFPLPPVQGVVTTDTQAYDVGIGAGLRFGDLRVDLAYHFQPSESNGQWLIRWGRVFASARWAIARRAFVSASVNTVDGGGGGSLGGTVHPTRDVDLSASGFYARGHLYTLESASYDRGGFAASAGWWLAPRFFASLGYQATGLRSGDTPTTWQHDVTASLVFRVP